MAGKVEGGRKGGRLSARWIDSLKEGTDLNLQELSRAVENKRFWRLLIHRVAMSGGDLMAHSSSSNNMTECMELPTIYHVFKH